MESQQLLTQGQVFQDKVLPGAKDRKYPAEQMYQTPKHDRILAECAPWTQAPKSLILRTYGIMASPSRYLKDEAFFTPVSYLRPFRDPHRINPPNFPEPDFWTTESKRWLDKLCIVIFRHISSAYPSPLAPEDR